MDQQNGKRTAMGLLLMAVMQLLTLHASAQCEGTWTTTPSGTLPYLCANGPFLQYDLGDSICPASPQATFTFSSPVQTLELVFSALGTSGTSGSSRLAVFLNDSSADLHLACRIQLGCQSAIGTYSLDGGCLVDQTAGTDGGISGYIDLVGAAYGLTEITSVGVAVSESQMSGTIFQIGSCNEACGGIGTGIGQMPVHERVSVFPDPFTTQATLRVGRDMSNATLTLFNARGQQVRQVGNIRGRTVVIHRDGLPSGLYYVQLTEGDRNVATTTLMVTDD